MHLLPAVRIPCRVFAGVSDTKLIRPLGARIGRVASGGVRTRPSPALAPPRGSPVRYSDEAGPRVRTSGRSTHQCPLSLPSPLPGLGPTFWLFRPAVSASLAREQPTPSPARRSPDGLGRISPGTGAVPVNGRFEVSAAFAVVRSLDVACH